MMDGLSTSETLTGFHQTTRRNIPEDSRLHNSKFDFGSVLESLFKNVIIL
jgi:hypothetical protein